MNLYLVKRPNGAGEKEYEAFVVACRTEPEARDFHPLLGKEPWDDENFGSWPVKRSELEVTLIGTTEDSRYGLILTSRN